MSGIYPAELPGGWQLIGPHAGHPLRCPQGPAYVPGSRRPGAVQRLSTPATGRACRGGRRLVTIEVVEPGALTSVQDPVGRPGWRHLGVPAGGAADPWSAILANRLVGNEDGAAVLEITLIGPTLRVLQPDGRCPGRTLRHRDHRRLCACRTEVGSVGPRRLAAPHRGRRRRARLRCGGRRDRRRGGARIRVDRLAQRLRWRRGKGASRRRSAPRRSRNPARDRRAGWAAVPPDRSAWSPAPTPIGSTPMTSRTAHGVSGRSPTGPACGSRAPPKRPTGARCHPWGSRWARCRCRRTGVRS